MFRTGTFDNVKFDVLRYKLNDTNGLVEFTEILATGVHGHFQQANLGKEPYYQDVSEFDRQSQYRLHVSQYKKIDGSLHSGVIIKVTHKKSPETKRWYPILDENGASTYELYKVDADLNTIVNTREKILALSSFVVLD